MEMTTYKTENDEIYEDEYGSEYGSDVSGLFQPASLDIAEEEWSLLTRTDLDLAAQIGYYLLKRNKELEMLIATTESCAEEHQIRANHYEKQIQYMRDSFETQSKIYEAFEKQVHELNTNYQQISDECRQYKERNKSLWEIVDNLEQKCDDYITELDVLKSNQACNNSRRDSRRESIISYDDPIREESSGTDNIDSNTFTRNSSIENPEEWESDIVSLKAFAEESSRKLDIERCQRLNYEHKFEKACSENQDLKNYILLLEHRLKSQSTEIFVDIDSDVKLIKSKSLMSLNDCNENETPLNFKLEPQNNNESEANHYDMLSSDPSDESTQNLSLRDLFQRLNSVGEINSEEITGNGTRRKSSTTSHSKHDTNKDGRRYTLRPSDKSSNDIICTICHSKMVRRDNSLKVTRKYEPQVSPRYESVNKSGETVASNYRDIFAQIFEKLKISRDAINKS